MAAGPGISVALSAVDKGLLSTLDSLGLKFAGLEGGLNVLGKAFNVAEEALRDFIGFMREASNYSAVQERSLVQLGAALRATGKDAQVTVEGIAQIAASLQKVTKFGDEVIIESSKWFAQMPRLDPTRMDEYLESAADLAEVMGTDLRTAAQVLSRALEDPRRASRALRRANIMLSTQQRKLLQDFDDMGEHGRNVDLILRAVRDSVGGAARAMADTLEGTRSQIRGIVADIKEHIGSIPNEALFPVTKALKSELEKWSAFMGNMIKENKDGMNSLADAGRAAAKGLELFSGFMRIYVAEAVKMSKALDDLIGKLAWFSQKFAWLKRAIDGLRSAGGLLFDMSETDRLDAEVRKLQESLAGMEEEGKDLGSDEEDAAYMRAKKRAEAREEWLKKQREWLKKMYEDTKSEQQIAIENYRRLIFLYNKGVASAEQMLRIRKDLVKTYKDAFEFEEKRSRIRQDLERTNKQRMSIIERLRRIDSRIADRGTGGFQSSITSLRGLWESQQQAAASIPERDRTVEELKRQREVLLKQLKETEKRGLATVKALRGVESAIRERDERTVAIFGGAR